MREKCETEIRHLRKLNHKNIVAFKGVCTTSPTSSSYCIVMEYCPYGQLCQYLKKVEFLYPTQAVEWSRQIASGMAYLHKHMIIHRDLKSPNVLISKNSLLKISDFGTSRQLNDYHSTKMSFAGTVAWMAPEVIRNEPCSEKVDVWSFGVVLWELFTLEIPYRDFEQSTIIYGVGNSTLTLPLPATFPHGYRLLMQMCWKPKPRNRPSFFNILTHIEIAQREIFDIKLEDFCERQRIWKSEVRSSLSQARISFHGSNSASADSADQMKVADAVAAAAAATISSRNVQPPSPSCLNHQTSCSSMLKQEESLTRKQEQIEQFSQMVNNVTSLYNNMLTVMADMAERERKLCKYEKVAYKKSIRKQDQMSSLLQMAVNDPVYKSALELSRQISADQPEENVLDPMLAFNLVCINKSILITIFTYLISLHQLY